MSAPARRTVGVMGGMGPAATVNFLDRVRRRTPARRDADYPRLLVDSAHAWADEIRAAVAIPFIDMVAETAAALARRPGLLAAAACLDARLYERAFAPLGLTPVARRTTCARASWRFSPASRAATRERTPRAEMQAIAQALLARGADAIVAGCTEVPLVLDAADVAAPLVDSAAVLTDRAVAYGLGAWTPAAPAGR